MLPECSYRGEQQEDAKGRLKWRCIHPKVKGGKEYELVRDDNCQQCNYCTWDAGKFIDEYRQTKPRRLVEADFALRVLVCDTCDSRAGNFCTAAGGCGLVAKLPLRDFKCPLNKHG